MPSSFSDVLASDMLGRLETAGTPKGFVPFSPGPMGKLGGLVVGLGVGAGAAPGAVTTGVATSGAVPTGKRSEADVGCGRGLGLVRATALVANFAAAGTCDGAVMLAATGRLWAI